jgi:hypothetical protein
MRFWLEKGIVEPKVKEADYDTFFSPEADEDEPVDRDPHRRALANRCLVTAAIVMGTYLGIAAIAAWAQPWSSTLNKEQVLGMPATFGSWRMDALEDKGLPPPDATVVVDRAYVEADSKAVVVAEVAAWTGPQTSLPHPPKYCYPGTGYSVESERALSFRDATGSSVSAILMSVRQYDRPYLVLYWYRMGDASLLSTESVREACWSRRGQRVWPPLVKVLLQTESADAKAAEDRLLRLASELAAWSATIR